MSADAGRELFDHIHTNAPKPPSESMRVGALLHTDPDAANTALAERSARVRAEREAVQNRTRERMRDLIARLET